MGGKSSSPSAPDPYKVSDAQTQSNQQTAAYNASLNRVDQSSPFGSLTWKQTGTDPNTGAPIWSQSTSLSPQLQSTFNSVLGNAQQGLAQPFNGEQARQDAQNAIYDRQTSMLDPQYQQQQTALNSQLAQQGITQGSDAYNKAQESFGRQRDYAYSNARDQAITGGQQELASMEQLRNMPLQELLQLRNIVSNPGSPTPINAPGTNLSGNVYNSYQGQLDAASSSNAGSNALLGGLFSLGGSLGSAWLGSDRRIKADVVELGTSAKGLPVYAFRYVWEAAGSRPHVGHMADEVEAKYPEAVRRGPDGFQRVNYGALQ